MVSSTCSVSAEAAEGRGAGKMITTNHNSPNGAPYLRHSRERNHTEHDGWTVTLKIAIPKPRHWLVCSTGWILMFLAYVASTFWVGGLHGDWYMSNNSFSSRWDSFLSGSVTSFLPIGAGHDTEGYGEPLVEPSDIGPSVSTSATTSAWPPIVPSSDSTQAPIVLSESREEIEATGLTLPGSNPTNNQGDGPAEYIVPAAHLKHEQTARFHPKWTAFDESDVSPSNETNSESLVSEPAGSTTTVDFGAMDWNPVNGSLNTTALAPGRAVTRDDQYSEGKDETSGTNPAETAGATPEASKNEHGESSTVENSSGIPLEDGNVGSKDEGTLWSRIPQSKEFHNPPGDESSLQPRKHEFTTSSEEAEAPDAASSSTNSSSAPTQVPTPTGSLSPTEPDREAKVEPEPLRGGEVPPPTSAVWNSKVEPVIRASKIRGRKAVEAFRSYLDCFSESGKWVYDPTPRHLPWNYVGEFYLSICDGFHWGVWADDADIIAREGVGEWTVREELKWIWQTNETCPLHQVDRNEFCRRLGPRRNIMVVGDSLNHGFSWEIMNHLITNGTGYERFPKTDRISDGVYEMCGDIFGAGNGFKVSFVRNDRLSLLREPVDDDYYNFHEYPWLDLVQEYNVKMLILNRGAHYENDTIYEKGLREALTAVKDRYPNVQVIYRNTPPGHANCTNATTVPPLTERQRFGWDGIKWPDFFSWGLYQGQNVLARKIVEEFGYIYMDLDTMLALRADGHPSEKDCLHYCLPGPFDIGVQLLYNILPFL